MSHRSAEPLRSVCGACEHTFVIDARKHDMYAYLLGLYLGDGSLASNGRSWQLRVTLDAAYPAIVDEGEAAIAAQVPDGRVHRRHPRDGACVVLESGWKDWPRLFPQHGPGRKHERPIVLA